MPGDATIVSGRRVADRYRLVDERAEHAWTAVDETLRRTVVVHVLPADADADAKHQFTAEARSLARLNHQNIVCTYDTGVDGDGTSYRVDELAGGHPLDLHAVDDRQRVPYALQITRAIADAHAAGLAHGELTSTSALVDETGRVQLRGLRLPPPERLAEMQHADIAALVELIIGLAPPTAAPLRDIAVAWRRTPPSSARDMLDEIAAIPDEAMETIPPHIPAAPTTGVPEDNRTRRTALAIGIAAALLAAVVVAVVLPARTRGDHFTGSAAPLHVTAKSFDPEAKPPTEREAETRFVVDGNGATVWRTDHYNTAAFGNLKHGVGLVLQTDGNNEFDTVTVTSPTRGWTLEVYVADEPAATLAGWGRPLTSANVQGAATTLSLNAARGGAVLLWITNLGPSKQVRIAEATVQGRVGK